MKEQNDKIALMIQKANEVMQHAYSPYSKYKVGACVEAEDGTLYCGCNIENASYGITVCAEVAAISSMISAGHKRIKSMVVMGSGNELCTPCGRCRQFIREFAAPDAQIYLSDKKKVVKTTNIAELLPDSFGPGHITG
jgi:cytidine deaminase